MPPYLSLNYKMENTIVKIVSYQYIPNWNCLLFNGVSQISQNVRCVLVDLLIFSLDFGGN